MIARAFACIAIVSTGAAAQAQFSFSNFQATYQVEGIQNPIDWNVSQSSTEGWVRLDDSSPAYQTLPDMVTNNNPSTVTYDAVLETPISSMVFAFTSDVTWVGVITIHHEVFANGVRIAYLNTARVGESLSGGGPNGVLTLTYRVDFTQSASQFSVVDNYNLENFAGGNYAHMISVEHRYNPVPEPAACLGLAWGAGAFLGSRRRRRR